MKAALTSRDTSLSGGWCNGADAARVAQAATRALYDELALYPKPGLVSFVDNGSHVDMTAATFIRSISALRPYFHEITLLGAGDAPFRELERLGIAAEQRMLRATGGVNTHRGSIFTLGLLCAAAEVPRETGAGTSGAGALRARLVERWGLELAARADAQTASNGQRVCRAHGLVGARDEAAAGFPVLFDVAVPTLHVGLLAGLDRRHAHLQTFFAVMATLDDTNLAHRGGLEGLRFAQDRARIFLAAGGAHRPDAVARAGVIHREFVARRLSPGGAADLLAAACLIGRICGWA